MLIQTNRAVFAPQYYGSVYYYAALMSCREAVIDMGLRYDKRFKSIHRTTIADVRGPLTITVPVTKPQCEGVGAALWSDVYVSSHGQWWADHRVSLESAYGRTPYFEFYIDRFLPWLSDRNDRVTDFDRGLDEVLRRTLQIDTEVRYQTVTAVEDDWHDWRRNDFGTMVDVPYYQVRADALGFIPGLSVLDLLFNMGPEAPLILNKMKQ